MKKRKRNYKCPLCKKVVSRVSDKKWIKSMCDSSGYKMTRLVLASVLLLTSCIAHKPIMESAIECDDIAASKWIKECISSLAYDSTQARLLEATKADCRKQAKELFCKPIMRERK